MCVCQVPTVHEVSGQEVQFALKVEEFLSSITIPEYRQVIVEVSKYSPLYIFFFSLRLKLWLSWVQI